MTSTECPCIDQCARQKYLDGNAQKPLFADDLRCVKWTPSKCAMTPNAAAHNPDPVQIRALLATANLTQATFARRIGVSTRTVSAWLAGTAKMPYSAQYCLEVLASTNPVGAI